MEIDHVEAVEFDNLNSMVLSLNAGQIDGMIVYFTVGSYLCRQNENLTSWLEYSEMEKIYNGEMTNVKNRFILDQILGTDFSFLMMEDHLSLRDEFNQATAGNIFGRKTFFVSTFLDKYSLLFLTSTICQAANSKYVK